MSLVQVILQAVLIACAFLSVFSSPLPDSAGLVEMPPGLAYGGIPYGSVTGMVANYYNGRQRAVAFNTVSGEAHSRQPTKPVYY